MSQVRRCFVLALLSMLLLFAPHTYAQVETVYTLTTDGPDSLAQGKTLFAEGNYQQAALFFWRAVLLQNNNPDAYTVEDAFQGFIQCYAVEGRAADGFVYIAKESMQRGQKEMAFKYLEQALAMDPNHEEAQHLKERYSGTAPEGSGDARKTKKRSNKFQAQYGTPEADKPLDGKSPEDLYEYGSTLFSRRNYEHCADVFELSCKRSGRQLGPACSNAIYCRMMLMDWGFNGTGFEEDMKRLTEMTESETARWRQGDLDDFSWQRATSVHPHMMLGYPVPSMLKRYVSESVAFMDEAVSSLL